MSRGKKILIAGIIIFLVMAGICYGAGVVFFSRHFLPGSVVNGFSCSFQTAEEVKELIQKRISSYELAVEERRNGREGITAEEAGLVFKDDGGVEQLLKDQDRFLWFLSLGNTEYEMGACVSYDQEKLEKTVKGLKCLQPENMTPCADAYLEYTGDGYEIVPEVIGSQLDEEKVVQAAGEALLKMKAQVNLEDEGCYVNPSVYQDDETLIKDRDQLNQWTDVIITYDFGDRAETVDAEKIRSWLVKDEDGNYTMDRQKVYEFVRQLGDKYDTVGKERTFVTYDRREVAVSGGTYGWTIDLEKETDALIKAVKSKVTQVREPVYSQEGKSRDTNDIGDTYVEIDLENQALCYYKDGSLAAGTQIVTGTPQAEGGLSQGVYFVTEKKSPATIEGDWYQGEVTYWVAFLDGLGLHEDLGRMDYSQTAYLTDPAAAGADVPADQMQIIYSNIETGTPVVVY